MQKFVDVVSEYGSHTAGSIPLKDERLEPPYDHVITFVKRDIHETNKIPHWKKFELLFWGHIVPLDSSHCGLNQMNILAILQAKLMTCDEEKEGKKNRRAKQYATTIQHYCTTDVLEDLCGSMD